MNETLRKFSAEIVKDFQQALATQQIEEVLSKIKAADSAATFSVVISTSDEDRQGDALDQTKWKLENYKNNPVVLWAHNYTELPIGVCTDLSVQGGKLVAQGKFAPSDLNPFAGQIAALYDAGFIKATSVGYIQHEDGVLELLEFSFVPVPANPYALSMREMKTLNLDIPQLVMKGLTFTAKAENAGDSCPMPDGSPGILAEDPANPGQLICVSAPEAKSAKSNENNGDMNTELTKNLNAEHGRHNEAVAKTIDEFGATCMKSEKSGESNEGADNSEYEKAVEEFKAATDEEQDQHLTACMKAINENYEVQDQKKGIDEIKSAFTSEHGEHVKAFHKSIEEFEKAFPDGDSNGQEKAIEEFTKAIGTELDRHQKAHMDICKDEMGNDTPDDEDEKSIQELVTKIGRQISAKNRERINAIIADAEDHHQKHIAALKDLMGPQGNEGEEPKDDKKSSPAPKRKVEVRDTRSTTDSFEEFMVTRRVLRTVDVAIGDALKDLNKHFREKFPARR